MVEPIALKLQPAQGLSLKQTQRLIMSQHMQQALNLLQLPVQELAAIVAQEMEQNPVLEYSEDGDHQEEFDFDEEQSPEKSLSFSDIDYEHLYRLDQDLKEHFAESRNPLKVDRKALDYRESLIIGRVSLFEHLMNQAKESFADPRQLDAAEALIGNFDESGFLTTPLAEISLLTRIDQAELQQVLKVVQSFEPKGVGAKTLRESLLIQLKGQERSLAWRVLSEEYDNLIQNKIPEIQRRLKCGKPELNRAIYQEIAKLDFHPGSSFSSEQAAPIVPDVAIVERGEQLAVVSNDEEYIPNVQLKPEYVALLEGDGLSQETRDFVRQKVMSAKWLLRNIHQRGQTLQRIAYALLERQRDFFENPAGQLTPLTMLALSEELDLHESTIARAVANKYIQTPRGLFPLRFFFSNALGTDSGEISSRTVKDLIKELIDSEDKKKPLSDQKLVEIVNHRGIECSRRTVAKYRSQLKLGNAHQRKKY